MNKYFTENTMLGEMTAVEENGKLLQLSFGKPSTDVSAKMEKTFIIEQTFNQLEEYFSGKRKTFSIPLVLKGTDFQMKVYKALCGIMYGETISYKQLAEKIGNPKACRAVGNANNKNPIAIIIPCHRVIGSNGDLVGYAGGVQIKQKLLEIEKNVV